MTIHTQNRLLISQLDNLALPTVIEPGETKAIETHKSEILNLTESLLPKSGALLFRGFDIDGIEGFAAFTNWFAKQPMQYDYGSTPRTHISGQVYTSTEYPPDQTIPLHNEMAYTTKWPMKLWFFSVVTAADGGETPIADSREIYRRIPQSIRRKFSDLGLLYVRNFRVGMDVPWQNVFNTSDKAQVEAICKKANIHFEWRGRDGSELRTRQLCQACAKHPQTGDMVWFNQAHLFHISNLEPRFRKAMLTIYKSEDLPRNVYYGDGSTIEDATLDTIRAIMDDAKAVFPWQKHDLLMVDNMLAAHGRNPFKGERRVAVAMAEPHGREIPFE